MITAREIVIELEDVATNMGHHWQWSAKGSAHRAAWDAVQNAIEEAGDAARDESTEADG